LFNNAPATLTIYVYKARGNHVHVIGLNYYYHVKDLLKRLNN